MVFWSKGQNPWDQEPQGERPAKAPAPECPWCAGEMERRWLTSARSPVFLQDQPPRFRLIVPQEAKSLPVTGWGGPLVGYFQTAWYCPGCRKLTAELPQEALTPFEEKLEMYIRQAHKKEGE